MLPEGYEEEGAESCGRADVTYKINFESKRIGGKIDGQEALEQAILLALLTKRYEYAIYPHSYGTEWGDVIGEGYIKAMAGAKTAITDSLMCDDRIKDVSDFEFEKKKNALAVSFKVTSVFGETIERGEVRENGYVIL